MLIQDRFDKVERNQLVEKSAQCLLTQAGRPGLDYLCGQRQIPWELIQKYEIGYVPSHIPHQLSGRIIFPVRDPSGNLIALASRKVVDSAYSHLPDYWHEHFEKSFYLYGMPHAKPGIRHVRYALVVEGQFDVLQLCRFGFVNTVGLMGTSLHATQIAVLLRYCHDIVLLLDNDENRSGHKAAERILTDFKDLGDGTMSRPGYIIGSTISIIPIVLPEQSDPDEFVRKYGSEAIQSLVHAHLGEAARARSA
jgi:DNA primase catalytic core